MKKKVKETIKELQNYYKIKNHTMTNLKNRIECIDTQLIGVGCMQYSDMPKAKNPKSSNRKEKLIMQKSYLEECIHNNKAFISMMEQALNNLEPMQKTILIECYAKDKRETEKDYTIYTKLNISSSTFYRMKKEVIEEFSINLFGVD